MELKDSVPQELPSVTWQGTQCSSDSLILSHTPCIWHLTGSASQEKNIALGNGQTQSKTKRKIQNNLSYSFQKKKPHFLDLLEDEWPILTCSLATEGREAPDCPDSLVDLAQPD